MSGGSVLEGGTGGRTALTFTIRLSWAHTEPITAYFRTEGGTAAAWADYESLEGSVTFQPGEGIVKGAIHVVGTVSGIDGAAFIEQARRVQARENRVQASIPIR